MDTVTDSNTEIAKDEVYFIQKNVRYFNRILK